MAILKSAVPFFSSLASYFSELWKLFSTGGLYLPLAVGVDMVYHWRYTFSSNAGPYSQQGFPTKLQAYQDALKTLEENPDQVDKVTSIVIGTRGRTEGLT